MTAVDTPRAKWLALALLATTQFVVVLDAAIVNVALPSIGRALDFSQDNLAWVVNAYTLTFGGFLLLGGRLADLLGRRKLFMIGLVVFSIASLLGGLAQSDVWLIAARALQGLGAALVSPAALSIVTNTFAEGAERNRALGIWGAVAGSGGAAGVLLGGILTEYLGWEWVLFVNVPIGVAAALLAPRLLAESHDEAAERSFDLGGAVTVTAGLSLLVYTLVDANSAGWGSTKTIVLGVLSLALLAAFVVIERRHRQPLVPFSIFRMQTIRGANIVALLIGMSLFSMFFFISLYMQQVLGYSALKTGVAYLPLALVIIFSAGGASVLVTRIGFKITLIIGMLFITAGLLYFSQVSAHGGTYLGDVLVPSILAAIGLGFAFVPVTIAAVTGIRPDQAGLASGLVNTSQQVGGALGLAILVAVANGATTLGHLRRRARPRGRPHRGLPGRVPGRRRFRLRGRDPRGDADLLARRARARRGRPPRRRRGDAGRRLTDPLRARLLHMLGACPSSPRSASSAARTRALSPAYLEAAEAVGRGLAQRGVRVVYGGGRVGMMGAVADAARAAGGEVVGIIPQAIFDLEIGHTGIDDLRVVGSMHERKALMAELSDAFIALPGGIGTLEELFEVYTWAQLGIHSKPLGLIDVAGYYQPLVAFLDHAVQERFLRPETRTLLAVSDGLDDLLATLETWEPVTVHKWIDLDQA